MIQSDKTKVGETKGKGVSGLNSIRDKTQLPTIAFKTFFSKLGLMIDNDLDVLGYSLVLLYTGI